jgi:hypothetical protein
MKAFRLLALLILTSVVVPALAQDEESYDSSGESSAALPLAEQESGFKPSRILPQVGGSLSTVVGDGTSEARNKPGLQVGVTADFGPAVAVGAKFLAGTSSEFFVEANYYRGLIQLWENAAQYNSSLALMGGFSLAL